MPLVLAILLTGVVTAIAVTAMLIVRRRAPEGSFFEDGDRASGVFGVLATGFFLLLGFIIFLAFESYDESRTGAETEALVLGQQIETAQFCPASVSPELTGQLLCYGRSVVSEEWDRMRAGTQGDALNPWGVALFRTLRTVEPKTATEQSAYDKWLDQTSDREAARLDRIHGAVGVIPAPMWVVLFFAAGLIFVYMLFFADSAERAVVQGMLAGSVAAVITASLLTLSVLDSPFEEGFGGLEPTAMERTLSQLTHGLEEVGIEVPLPCDESGTALGTP
jgi:hypothetical protein